MNELDTYTVLSSFLFLKKINIVFLLIKRNIFIYILYYSDNL